MSSKLIQPFLGIIYLHINSVLIIGLWHFTFNLKPPALIIQSLMDSNNSFTRVNLIKFHGIEHKDENSNNNSNDATCAPIHDYKVQRRTHQIK